MDATCSNPPRPGTSAVRFAEGADAGRKAASWSRRGATTAATALALFLLAPLPAALAVTGDPDLPGILNAVVAVVDGDPITMHDLDDYGRTGAPFLPPEVRSNRRALLSSMIERRLLKAEFAKNGISAGDDMTQHYIASVLEESGQTRATLDTELAKAGLSWKDYFERMREEVERMQLVNMEIRSRVNVPEEEVRRAWEEDDSLREDEKLEVAAIFLPAPMLGAEAAAAREQAAVVRKEAQRDFAKAARKYSKGPGAEEGGDLGAFRRGTMASHFEKALEGLHKGDVSEPVEGPGGLYLVKLKGIESAGRKPFDEVKKELADRLYEKRLQERYRKWATEDLRRDHHVEELLDDLPRIVASASAAPAAAAPAAAGAPPASSAPAKDSSSR